MDYGLELIKKTFALQTVERIPWVPFVGCHGGHLIDVDAEKYLKSSNLIVQGITKSVELYKPDGIPIIFDLQIEAEILGCNLAWSKENPPAVVSHPLSLGTNLEELNLPTKESGRIPIVLEATKQLRDKYPELALYGLITGPFTLALHLLGTDIFLKMFEDPEAIKSILSFCTEVCMKMTNFYLDEGVDVIAVVDPMTSQIDSESFELFLTGPITKVFDHIRNRGKLSSFFVCGNAQQNIETMCKCNPDNISIDENISLDYVKGIALENNLSFGGNLKLTSVLLLGDEHHSQQHTIETTDLGGNKGFILSPGCDLPMNTPKENLIAIAEIIHDEYKRDIARNLKKVDENFTKLDLNDHWQQDKVVIDIITLDSSSCAPCQYMVEAVKNASSIFGDKVIISEFKIKEKTGIQMMMSLGVKNLPTICMNGKVEFISKIPPQNDLIKTIEKHLGN